MTDRELPERLADLAALSCGEQRADTLIRLTCGRALALPPLPPPVDLADEHTERDAVLVAFAEQFAVDVTGIGDNQRRCFLQTFGDNAFRMVVAIFVADFLPRVWAGCDALGIGKPGWRAEVQLDAQTDPVGAVLGGFVPAVARLR